MVGPAGGEGARRGLTTVGTLGLVVWASVLPRCGPPGRLGGREPLPPLCFCGGCSLAAKGSAHFAG